MVIDWKEKSWRVVWIMEREEKVRNTYERQLDGSRG